MLYRNICFFLTLRSMSRACLSSNSVFREQHLFSPKDYCICMDADRVKPISQHFSHSLQSILQLSQDQGYLSPLTGND